MSVNGGNARNAIPSYCKMSVTVPKGKEMEFLEIAESVHEQILKEYKVIETKGPILEVKVEEYSEEKHKIPFNKQSLGSALMFVLAIPHGVLRMHPEIPGLVEASQNVALLNIEGDEFKVEVFLRSSSNSQMTLANGRLAAIATSVGPKCKYVAVTENDFPIWEPVVTNNPILDIVKSSFVEINKKEPEVYSIHAGLENAVIGSRYPNLFSVSIGPTIQEPHSPQERLEIKTVGKNYELLRRVVEKTASVKKN